MAEFFLSLADGADNADICPSPPLGGFTQIRLARFFLAINAMNAIGFAVSGLARACGWKMPLRGRQ